MTSTTIENTLFKTQSLCQKYLFYIKGLAVYGAPYCISILAVFLSMKVSRLFTSFLSNQNTLMIYVLVVTFIATRYGLGPSLLCWLLSIFSYSYFMGPSYFNWEITDWHNLLTFAAVLLLAVIMSRRTMLLKRYSYELEQLVSDRTYQLSQTVNELSEANIALKNFAKIASHDLREPLKAIQGYVELIKRRYYRDLSDELRSFIDPIYDGVNRMDRLIQGVSTVCRMEIQENKFAACNLNLIVNEVIANLNTAIVANKAIITTDLLPTLTVDRGQLVHLFQNLISNAIKYRRADEPKIHISVQECDQEWIFSISDNGIGIDKKFYGQIFEMFHRLHSRIQYPGDGIGLAICKTIIENHKGKIWVESKANIGSTFKFSLPKFSLPKKTNEEEEINYVNSY
jgi:signal transduction histidine kinase